MNKKKLRSYRIWKAMKSRCYSPSQNKGYYKKDNIIVCKEWKNSYDNFIKDMGIPNYEDYSIERIDYLKPYCKENCKWIHINEQSKNRRICKIFTYNNKSMVLKDWAKEFGINYSTLWKRIYVYGLPFELAIEKDAYNRLVTINEQTKTVTEWCKELNLNSGVVFSRINRGWSKEDAILIPIKSR